MSQPPDLEPRVSALEARAGEIDERLRRSEQDSAAARVLAGGADRDVTGLSAESRAFREQHNRVLNAMRADLNGLRERMDTGFTEMRQKLDAVDLGFIELRGRLDAAAAGQQQIADLLGALISAGDQAPRGEPGAIDAGGDGG